GDMGVQALILNMVNLGKFFYYFGNVDATGEKGEGPGSNSCFIDYNDSRAKLIIGNGTGACTDSISGHPELDQSTEAGRRRMCEGFVLLTNFLDILENIDLSQSSSLSKF